MGAETAYNDQVALIYHKLSEPTRGIIFADTIPKPNDRALIDSILSELLTMRIGNFANEDINLTSSNTLNEKIRQALDPVVDLAIKQERFANPTIRNNFIAKLMIWCNLYLEDLDFSGPELPKCLFYGVIKRHEFYFLMLLAKLGIDVLYFNPTGDQTAQTLDTLGLMQTITLGNATGLTPLMDRVAKGVVIEKVTTYARKATNELEQTLYQDSGIYKPWQFSDGTTYPIIMDSVIEDTLTYWDEPARMRPGFKTVQKTVYTPIFFSKISGVYRDQNEYFDLVNKLRNAPKCCFYESSSLTSVGQYAQTRTIQYHNLQSQTVSNRSTQNTPTAYNQQDLYSLAFCLNPDKTINREALREHKLYQRMLMLRGELQNFLLNKLEELFSPNQASFFNFPITDKERLRLMAAIFTADDKLLNLIDGYDFTGDIPKVVMYLNSRDPIQTDDALLLGLLRMIGLDIIILSPNGANNIELVINEKFINQIKLEEFVYDLPLKAPTKKSSFFGKLFR